MTLHLVELSQATPQPWRNGGGVTRELLAWPPGSGADWLVRVSVADIDRDGPFSPFSGVQRCFTVLEGAGVVLDFAGQEKSMTPAAAPLAFDGAQAPGCRLIDGPTRDLNLMGRASAGRVSMWPARAGDSTPANARWFGLYAATEMQLHAEARQTQAIPARSLVWCDQPGAIAWRLEAINPSTTCEAWWMSLHAAG